MTDYIGPPKGVGGGYTESVSKGTSAATTNETVVKASAGTLLGGSLRNRAASERYFKIYNKATAGIPGTDTPVMTIGLPAASITPLGALLSDAGLSLPAGIAFGITGAYADADATAIAASDVDWNLIYL